MTDSDGRQPSHAVEGRLPRFLPLACLSTRRADLPMLLFRALLVSLRYLDAIDRPAPRRRRAHSGAETIATCAEDIAAPSPACSSSPGCRGVAVVRPPALCRQSLPDKAEDDVPWPYVHRVAQFGSTPTRRCAGRRAGRARQAGPRDRAGRRRQRGQRPVAGNPGGCRSSRRRYTGPSLPRPGDQGHQEKPRRTPRAALSGPGALV